MDNEFASIKIKSRTSFKWDNSLPLTEPQVSSWLKVLEGMEEKMFNIGLEDEWFSLGQIRQMDFYTLNKHLSQWKNLKN